MMKRLFVTVLMFFAFAISSVASYAAVSGTVTRGKLGKDDMMHWDGTSGDSKYERETSSGYTLYINKFDWVGVDVYSEYGGGVSRSVAAILNAVSDIGRSPNVNLWLSPGTWTMTSGATLYENHALSIPSGTTLVFSAGATLWLKGPLNIGDYPVFDCTASGSTVYFQENAVTGFVKRKWFNANWNEYGLGKVPDSSAKLNIDTMAGTTLTGTWGKFNEVRAKSSSGLKLFEDSGVSGIFINDSGDVFIYKPSLGNANLYFYSASTLISHEAQPGSGGSGYYVTNQVGGGNISFRTTQSTTGTNIVQVLYSNGNNQPIYQSGVSMVLTAQNGSNGYIWGGANGEFYWSDTSANNTLQTSHNQENNMFELNSTNSITGEGQIIELERFFRDCISGKITEITPAVMAGYAKFAPPLPPEVVRERLLAKEAKEREEWKRRWKEQNPKASAQEAEAAAVQGYKPNRPKWLKERAGLN